jgi:hypothetical protein
MLKLSRYLLNYSLFLVLISLLFGCEKTENTPKIAERGKIISQSLVQTNTKTEIGAVFQLIPQTAGQVEAKYDVALYKIIYETVDANNVATQASGLVAVPLKVDVALPIASFQHGTVLRKTDVPSQLGTGFQIGLAFGTEGYLTAMPDFLGLGESPNLHNYVHAKTEATACVDMLRATKNLAKSLNINLNNQLFIFGYSQGGHATLALHREIEAKHNTEFTITASAPMAAPTDLSGLQMDSLLRNSDYVAPGYLPYVLYGLNPIYKMYPDLSSVFISPFNTSLQKYFTPDMPFNMTDLEATLPSSKIAIAIMKPEEVDKLRNNRQTHPVSIALRDNDLYDWKPVAPLKFCHCDKDRHVPYASAEKARSFFEKNGSAPIEIINPLKGGDHGTCLFPSLLSAKRWFSTLKK